VLVDINIGSDIPRTEQEAMSVALRTGAKELNYGGKVTSLDGRHRQTLAGELEVRLSPLVQRVVADGDKRIVRFRRHLAERVLVGDRARLVDEFAGGKSLTLAAVAVLRGET